MRVLKPIDAVKAESKKFCPYLLHSGYCKPHECCSLVGEKLEGTNDEFYYKYHGEKPCLNIDWQVCPLNPNRVVKQQETSNR
jgi:hypothetical protein